MNVHPWESKKYTLAGPKAFALLNMWKKKTTKPQNKTKTTYSPAEAIEGLHKVAESLNDIQLLVLYHLIPILIKLSRRSWEQKRILRNSFSWQRPGPVM